jgi:aerobic-type carbon monoxide dehydrogenase small subunit (CoxS/CutS family)
MKLRVNGREHDLDLPDDTPLLWALRDGLGMSGTKYGCGMALCGACTVHVDGVATRSCVTPLAAVAGREVLTIEGLSEDASHPVQRAWIEADVAQCGYCTCGFRSPPTPSRSHAGEEGHAAGRGRNVTRASLASA